MTGSQLERYFKELIRKKGSKALTSISMFLEHEKALFRQKSVQALGNLEGKEVAELLIQMLEDTALSVRKEAVNSYIKTSIQDLSYLEHIKETTTDDKLAQHIHYSLQRASHTISGVISVAEFINHTNTLLSQEEVKIQGELSSYQVSSYATNQWVFFDLKDEKTQAKIRCFSTLFVIRSARISPIDGMRLVITGKARISPKSGTFSIQVSQVELTGEGELLKAYEMLKMQLQQEGMFLVSRKRDIPSFPQTIGLVTSQDAAAYKDFTKVLQERMGGLQIYFHHAQVQGDLAVQSIVQAINTLSSYPEVDVIVVTRGGGSMDDLHAFNDEQVARAIYASQKPIISAVGHERDETIADYVADLRASTPSNAAELLVPHRDELLKQVDTLVLSIEEVVKQTFQIKHHSVHHAISTMVLSRQVIHQRYTSTLQTLEYYQHSLRLRLSQKVAEVTHFQARLIDAVMHRISDAGLKIDSYQQHIQSFDTTPLLRRGFSIVRYNKAILTDSFLPTVGENLEVTTAGHIVEAVVTTVRSKKEIV